MKFVVRYIMIINLILFLPKISYSVSGDTTKSEFVRKFLSFPTGQVSLGYDYGYIPFAQTLSVPSGYFKTEGNFSFQVKDIPFVANFFYTDLKNITGLNNYFRVSFDLQVYKQKVLDRAKEKVLVYDQKVTTLQKQFQQTQQKLLYFNHLNKDIEKHFRKHYEQIPHSSISIDSLNADIIPPLSDTLVNNPIQFDSLRYEQMYSDYKDSLQKRYDDLIRKAEYISKKIDEFKKLSKQLMNPIDPASAINVDSLVYRNKLEKWFCHLKKLEVGLCYPSYSTFLVNAIAVKGINMEYENKNRFYAFTVGSSINNLLFTNNIIQNNLQNTQNLFNFFDFSNLQQGRKIISAKTGVGKKEGNHLFVGGLYSIGQQSYYYDSTQQITNGTQPKEHNLVIEFDGNIQFKKWLNLNVVYGKSSLRPLNDDGDTTGTSLSQLFSPFRSNAALGKITLNLSKIKSNVTLSGRWIDPFFRSYGIGFMQSDDFRYEIKTNHQMGKKTKIGLFYRKDQNNLLNLFSYTTILHSGGINFQYRINKQFSVRGNFNPVFQYSSGESDQQTYSNQNYIGTLLLSHSSRNKEISYTSNISSSYYKLFNGITNNNYMNVTVSNSIHFKKCMNNLSASFFKMNGTDSLSGNTFMLYNDWSFQIKKIKVSSGIKYSCNHLLGNQVGYSLKVFGSLSEKLGIELRGEKLVLGDFYNSIGIEQYRSYPYLWTGRVIINW